MVAARLALLGSLFFATLSGAGVAGPTGDPGPLTDALANVSVERMLNDVARLSSPELNGRQTGTADDLRSGLLVAERFRSLGMKPGGTQALPLDVLPEPWTMPESVSTIQIGNLATLDLSTGSGTITAGPGKDFLPILDSPSVNLTTPVVFVGYGISDPARGFDEYEGLDVHNRVVLFLRGKPAMYAAPVTHADKEKTAREKGAVAFLTATGPVVNAYEARRGISDTPMALYGRSEGEHPLPGAWISTELAKRILTVKERSLLEVQEQLNRATLRSFSTGALAHLAWDSRQEPGMLYNVLGVIPGQNAGRGTETLIIGAHRDHFGRQAGLLFPGADDNASGTAILLEVARAFTQSGLKPKRSILFVSFSGEEQGMLGSRLYVRYPTIPLDKTIAMINVDHAGVGNGTLTVGVTGLPKSVGAEAGRLAGLADTVKVFGFFPGGDHVPFKEAGVPTVTVVSGGPHPHFHQPPDTVETLQHAVLEAVARFVLTLAWQLANAE
jgi:hypothetical protein